VAHIGVEPLGTVVFIIGVTCATFPAAANVRAYADTIANLEAGLLGRDRADTDSRADNLMAAEGLALAQVISEKTHPATSGSLSKLPQPLVRVWMSEPQTLRGLSGVYMPNRRHIPAVSDCNVDVFLVPLLGLDVGDLEVALHGG
jgi:hypothetical protein